MAASRERERTGWRIGDVLERTDLGALLDELAQPTGRLGPGRRWHCPMPDHDDHRASVSMHRDHHGHERWRCWSGDHRGDAVDLVIVTTGRTRSDAVDWLASRAGMIPDRPLPPVPRKSTPPSAAPARVMDPVVARYAKYCAQLLETPAGAPVRAWLHARGINDATIAANRIGVDPGRRQVTRRRGLPYGAGIAATFPAFDAGGAICYVQARYLHPEQVGRKYDNPAAALAPHPRLAYPIATGGHRGDLLAVCEGIPDALIATQAGYSAVALLGAQTPDESVAIRIADYAQQRGLDVALVCDPDAAGRRAAEVLAPLLAAQGAGAMIVTPPDGLDLNAWALADPEWAVQLDRATRHVTDTGIATDAHTSNDPTHTADRTVSAGVEM